ncbi:MAG TPA: hypothetical protein VFY79_13700, partial [Dehalococcoidia bacterium]|nr:hypothetical protein [Dehalococcoidia bacterium]
FYYAGDNRSDFDPDGSFRTRQTVIVVPEEASSASGIASGTAPMEETGTTRQYASDALDDHSLNASDDDGVLQDCHLENDVGHASTSDMHIAVTRTSPHSVSAHIYGNASNPLIPDIVGWVRQIFAITWDYTINLDTSTQVTKWSIIEGCHDYFPAFQVYVNGQLIDGYSPGPGPWPDFNPAAFGLPNLGRFNQECVTKRGTLS